MALRTPNPTPHPAATTARPGHCRRSGRGLRVSRRQPAASTAASTERPAPTTRGSNPRRARTVAGTVPEKASTPPAAHHIAETGIEPLVKALLLSLMSKGSTIHSLVKTLRAELAACHPGDRMPSTRELVQRHRARPVTVSRALAVLAADGLVITRPGA